ncbi:MAG TPA: rhodanese-like domain-containing protein [Casimicrobiaceae bacterium]|nr:rhodanese-like domain-containing protein [Casimicrobiaceae bacterium]
MPPADETGRADLAEFRARAEARAKTEGVAFRGSLMPVESWALFSAGEMALVDTRTLAERDLIGYVPGSIAIEWYDYPAKKRNERFLDQLRELVEPDRPVAFLCRSGVRSKHAATLAAANGYGSAFNILHGFEGDKNAQGQRVVNGWRVDGLPWRQD